MTGEEHIIEEDCWLLVFLMRPLVMLLLVIGYLKSEPYVAKLRTKLKLRKKANKRLFTLTVVAHNVALAVFSAKVASSALTLFLTASNQWSVSNCFSWSRMAKT